ncbi:stress response serine/threonine protein kinase YihE [Chromatiales bacterium (ex Bugula neritina AB1)]|nr:stress response serine/threonine protein kinase YihE [Chromatiales bacterium (ex Bugula neritina AB1)]
MTDTVCNTAVPADSFSSLSPDLILEAIESQPELLCDGRLLALNSYENRVYRVGLEDAQPVIAKFYRPQRWTREQILEEHAFALELAEHEIPVVAPLANAEGDTLRECNGFEFALYPVKGGRTPELDNPEQLQLIGRFIARLHQVAETSSFNHRPVLDTETLGHRTASYLIDNNRLPPELRAAYKSLTTDLLQKVDDRFDSYRGVRQIRLHGDFHPGNILWRDDKPHIVDLDDARTGPCVQDLWLFLSGDRFYQQERLADLLDGYTMFREFDSAELGLIEPLRTLRIIHYASWLDQRREEPAFQQAFPWLASARYWDDHILALKEQSSALDEPILRWD